MSAGSLIGRDRLRARPERRLVRRQLEYLGHAGRAALAGHIRRDIEQAGTGLWTRGSHYQPQSTSIHCHAPPTGPARSGGADDTLGRGTQYPPTVTGWSRQGLLARPPSRAMTVYGTV